MLQHKLFHCSSGCMFRVVALLEPEPPLQCQASNIFSRFVDHTVNFQMMNFNYLLYLKPTDYLNRTTVSFFFYILSMFCLPGFIFQKLNTALPLNDAATDSMTSREQCLS
ncbi:hypothetical protein AMECASPLE_000770 [Ameca splendens]|uniref:Uncharacterized protein n=1 Tax=Ameca splendens TaxID=208324 RepID=A0ABV0ZU00_9TELE